MKTNTTESSSDWKLAEVRRIGDTDADFAVRNGRIHCGYKAHISVDEEHNLIRHITMTSARVENCTELLLSCVATRRSSSPTRPTGGVKHSDLVLSAARPGYFG